MKGNFICKRGINEDEMMAKEVAKMKEDATGEQFV